MSIKIRVKEKNFEVAEQPLKSEYLSAFFKETAIQ